MALPCLGAVARGVRSSEAPPSVVLGDRGNFVTSTPFALPQRSIVRELKHVGALLVMPEGLSVGDSRPVSLLPLMGHEDNNGAQTPAARAPLAPQNQYTTDAGKSAATPHISIPGTTSSAKDEEQWQRHRSIHRPRQHRHVRKARCEGLPRHLSRKAPATTPPV